MISRWCLNILKAHQQKSRVENGHDQLNWDFFDAENLTNIVSGPQGKIDSKKYDVTPLMTLNTVHCNS